MRYKSTVAIEPKAASVLIGACLSLYEATSANVYFPRFLNCSAIKNKIIGQPTKKPIEYISPSNPLR